MKEVVAVRLGVYRDARRRPGSTFWVEDDFQADWVAPVGTVEVPATSGPEREMTIGEMAEKPVSLQQALSRRGRKKAEEPPAPQRNLNVLGGE